MDPQFLQKKFSEALAYADYLATGTDEQRRRWAQVLDSASLTDPQRVMLANFTRAMNVLVISGIWCGDCVQQVPLLRRIEEANPAKIKLRILDRDAHKDLSSQFRINGGDRVPVALLLSEDFDLCSNFGDRTIHRLAHRVR
jgi:thiol-disulfide isomerase/thioredoxin